MIMSSVVCPDIFQEENFDAGRNYRSNVHQFLEGIRTNGLIVVDPREILKQDLIRSLDRLPTSKVGNKIPAIMVELLKGSNGRKVFISCKDSLSLGVALTCSHLAQRVGNACAVDKVFDAIDLSWYVESEYEKKRRTFERSSNSLHQMSRQEIEEIIIRSIRFSKRLQFYDSQLGRISDGELKQRTGGESYEEKCGRFYEGVEYIVGLWKRHGHFLDGGDKEGEIEIITPIHWKADDAYSITLVKKTITKAITERLSSAHKVGVALLLKHDTRNVFHDRFLYTQSATLLFGRGFDLFTRSGRFKSNTVKLVDAKQQLEEYDGMESAESPRWQGRR